MSKSETTKKASSSGIGLSTVLFLIFLILKLSETGPIAKWSWWAVTSPLWIPPVLVIGIGLLIAIGYLIYILIKTLNK